MHWNLIEREAYAATVGNNRFNNSIKQTAMTTGWLLIEGKLAMVDAIVSNDYKHYLL